MFSSLNPTQVERALEEFEPRVSASMNDGLRMSYYAKEVRVALSQMHPIKAPGFDGCAHYFFQTYWHIVGPSVTSVVLDILNGVSMPVFVNKIYIVLISGKK